MIQDDGHDGDDDRQRDDLRVGLQPHCRKKFARWARMLTRPPSRLWAASQFLGCPQGSFTKDQGSQGFQQEHLHTVASFGRVMVATLGNL